MTDATCEMSQYAKEPPPEWESKWTWRTLDGGDRAMRGAMAHKLFQAPELHDAARRGDQRKVIDLLDRRAFGVDDPDPGGRTALHFAVGFGHESVVMELLRRNCDIDKRDDWMKSPVDFGLQAKHDRCVQAIRLEAVKRGLWGGKGRVAPLKTYWEHCYNMTSEEVEEKVRENAEEARKNYSRQQENDTQSYQEQLKSRVKQAIEAKARGRKRR
ncbi:Ankyrin repeat [Ostreococcus tauri]|jgi:hypothetical protein|uniref:Ankyrin repeat n=2 Tax=Ostreococcus tauri TaxID=70448 RepID=A0A096PAI4_OSTTA|nr:Ankyrin repeat [Ostreococcus tauri]CEG01939.1 Ankyrin repeat [Ostreococcus tauri]|eukprot:XP_003082795.2 Ankyrin repeat [Ostreococcus tauri]